MIWSNEAAKGVSNPVKKLIVCNLEAAMQLVVLTMDSPFKVYCAFICRIINITVFIHIILCVNICNMSISIPNKVAIEKVRTSFGHKTIGAPWFNMVFSGVSRLLQLTTITKYYIIKFEINFKELIISWKKLSRTMHIFLFVHDPKSTDEWGCWPSLCI